VLAVRLLKTRIMTKYEKYVDKNGNYFYKLKLESDSEFTVEKELGDYLHQLEQKLKGVTLTDTQADR
jgi:hypothetical protein